MAATEGIGYLIAKIKQVLTGYVNKSTDTQAVDVIDCVNISTLDVDSTPTASSTNLVTSGGVKTYVDGHHDNTKQDTIDAQHKLSYNLLSDTPTIPTKTSDLSNDSGFLTSHQDISGKEDKSNKVTSLSASSTDDEFPSAKCVYDIVGDIESTLQAIRGV